MKSGIILLLIGLLAFGITPAFSMDDDGTRMVDLSALNTHQLSDDELREAGTPEPQRDPGDDEIFYDDGDQALLIIRENYWSRVSFEPRQDFTLEGFRLQFYNPNGLREPIAEVYIYSEDQNDQDLDDILWEDEIGNMPNMQWVAIDLDEEDFIDFEQGETFSIIFGRAPGGQPPNAQGWWNIMDEDDDATHSYFYSGNEPAADHGDWEETGADLFIRANGTYGGDVVDLAVSGIAVEDEDGTSRWTTKVGQERNVVAEITNRGSTVDGFILTYEIEDAEGELVWDSDIVLEEEFDGQDVQDFIPEDMWTPEEAGVYYLTAEVTPFAEDGAPDDNIKLMELIVIDPMDPQEDVWATYCQTDYDWERSFFNTDSTAFATYFYHDGSETPLTLTSFRVCLNVPNNTPQEDIPFGVFLLDPERGWQVAYTTEVEVDETGDGIWHEVVLEEEDQVTFENPYVIIIAWFFREIGDNQNNWIMMKHDESDPISGGASRMPTTNRWGDDLWGTGFANAWSTGEWAIEAQFVGGIPQGPHMTIEPEELDFGYGLEMDQDYTITASFISFGTEDAEITDITAQGDAGDALTFEMTEFAVSPGETTYADITFNFSELVNVDTRIRVEGNAAEFAQGQFFWPITGGTMHRVVNIDDDDVRFGRDLATFEVYTQEVIFTNPSVEVIEITEIQIPEAVQGLYTFDPETFEIQPDETVTVTVTFSSADLVNADADIVLINTSQNEPELVLDMEARVTVLDVGDDLPVIPAAYSLSQNHPNPFNPTTTVDFSIQVGGQVELSVFNMNGKLIQNVANGYHSAGNHSVEIDASDLPAGVYMYRLVSSDFTSTRKMVLLK